MPNEPGGRDLSRKTGSYVNCPQCGCPNKDSDRFCSYCEAPIDGKPAMSARFRRAVETLRWRYKLKSRKTGYKTAARKRLGALFTIFLGLALTALGGWFLVSALATSAFSEFAIGAMFALYGVYSIIHVVKGGV